MAGRVLRVELEVLGSAERIHYKTTTLGPRLGPRIIFGPRLGGALVAPRHRQSIT